MTSVVIAAIDSSAAARPVLQAAEAYALLIGASVQALHVDAGDDACAVFAAAHEIAYRGLTGDVIESLVGAAAVPEVSAIVLGARGRPGGPSPAGHVALAVIARVERPVIVVPPDAPCPEQLTRILLPVEGHPDPTRVPDPLLELLAGGGAEIAALHVDDDSSLPGYSDQIQHETEAFAREFVARNIPCTVDVDVALRVGRPGTEVLAACDPEDVDLVVLAWSRDLSSGRAEIVRELLSRSRVPVMLVPTVTSDLAPLRATRGTSTEPTGRVDQP